jgi:hypothetical protein
MLELQKFVLQRVCDDKGLFKKELRKSLGWLKLDELEILREWVVKNFWNTHQEEIIEVFYPSFA